MSGRKGRRAPSAGGPVHRALEGVLARCDVAREVDRDPVRAVHRYADPADAELVGLVASAVAFGNVTALLRKLDDALDRLGPAPARAADDPAFVRRSLRGWKHRVYVDGDLAALVVGARRVQVAHGSIGAFFGASLARAGALWPALTDLVDALRSSGLARRRTLGARHILPDPRGASGCKRLLLYLRWMVRGPDGVDLGLWRDHVPPAALLIPVDVHIHKLARNLGLTDRPTPSLATTAEITDGLRRFDPVDPVRFDFALCHMGMLRACPSRRDPIRCDGCPVRDVCRHWD